MAITINGSGTITGVSAGGLPDGCVTADDLATTLDLSGNTITLPSGTGGKVLQVVSTANNTGASTSSTSWQSTGVTATITPSSTSSKILAIACVQAAFADGGNGTTGKITLFRGTTSDTNLGHSAAGLQMIGNWYINTAYYMSMGFNYLDSPSTASAQTYTIGYRSESSSSTMYVQPSAAYTILTLMEIAG